MTLMDAGLILVLDGSCRLPARAVRRAPSAGVAAATIAFWGRRRGRRSRKWQPWRLAGGVGESRVLSRPSLGRNIAPVCGLYLVHELPCLGLPGEAIRRELASDFPFLFVLPSLSLFPF